MAAGTTDAGAAVLAVEAGGAVAERTAGAAAAATTTTGLLGQGTDSTVAAGAAASAEVADAEGLGAAGAAGAEGTGAAALSAHGAWQHEPSEVTGGAAEMVVDGGVTGDGKVVADGIRSAARTAATVAAFASARINAGDTEAASTPALDLEQHRVDAARNGPGRASGEQVAVAVHVGDPDGGGAAEAGRAGRVGTTGTGTASAASAERAAGTAVLADG